MNKLVDERDIIAANMAVCKRYGGEFAVARTHDLTLIAKQVVQMSQRDGEHRVAHLVYMISKLKPFASNNQRTALVIGAVYAKRLHIQFDLATILGLIKHDVSAKNIAEILSK